MCVVNSWLSDADKKDGWKNRVKALDAIAGILTAHPRIESSRELAKVFKVPSLLSSLLFLSLSSLLLSPYLSRHCAYVTSYVYSMWCSCCDCCVYLVCCYMPFIHQLMCQAIAIRGVSVCIHSTHHTGCPEALPGQEQQHQDQGSACVGAALGRPRGQDRYD